MIKKIKDVELNYIDYGKKDGQPLVFLHGWGQNIEMMKPIADPFSKEFRIVILDLPSFGDSSEPSYAWNLNDFVDMLHILFSELEINDPILLGHSFGGKISLLYATKHCVKKMVLFGSPYKKEVQKTGIKLKILKSLKKIPLINKLEGFAKKHIGSTDYRNASPIQRQILVNHVNFDLTEQLKRIKAPTLLVWGTLDAEVPLKQAYELENLIDDAGVVVFENCTHYAYLENLGGTIGVLRKFL